MITKSGIKTAALKIGTAIISRVLSALLLRFQQKVDQPEDFQFLEAFPEDMIGVFSIGSFTGSYYNNSSYGSSYIGGLPGTLKDYNYSDVDNNIVFKYLDSDLLKKPRGYSFDIISDLKISSGYSEYMRFNIDSEMSSEITLSLSAVKTLDFYKSSQSGSGNISFDCPSLQRIRLTSQFYAQIKDAIPAGVKVYIKDYD